MGSLARAARCTQAASSSADRMRSVVLKALAQMSRRAQDEAQDLGNGAVKSLGNLLLDIELHERPSEFGILANGDPVRDRRVDDLLAIGATPGGDDAWRTRLLIL